MLLRIRERCFPRTEFSRMPVIGRLIPLLLRRARSPVVDDVHGHRMCVDEKDSMGLSIDPAFEPVETTLCLGLIKSGDVVVDIGANIGYYALLFARQVGPLGTVVAFEPDADNFRLLTANVGANGYTNVRMEQAAVSAATAQLVLYLNEVNRMDHRTYDAGDGRQRVSIRAVSLDDYFATSASRVNLIKMDIQGSEPDALEGMTRLLGENPDVVLVTEFWPYGLRRAGHDPAAFLARLGALGFSFSEIHERRGSVAATTSGALLHALDERDKWSATNLVCARRPLPVTVP
jgi:FkbM family methyltransferase